MRAATFFVILAATICMAEGGLPEELRNPFGELPAGRVSVWETMNGVSNKEGFPVEKIPMSGLSQSWLGTISDQDAENESLIETPQVPHQDLDQDTFEELAQTKQDIDPRGHRNTDHSLTPQEVQRKIDALNKLKRSLIKNSQPPRPQRNSVLLNTVRFQKVHSVDSRMAGKQKAEQQATVDKAEAAANSAKKSKAQGPFGYTHPWQAARVITKKTTFYLRLPIHKKTFYAHKQHIRRAMAHRLRVPVKEVKIHVVHTAVSLLQAARKHNVGLKFTITETKRARSSKAAAQDRRKEARDHRIFERRLKRITNGKTLIAGIKVPRQNAMRHLRRVRRVRHLHRRRRAVHKHKTMEKQKKRSAQEARRALARAKQHRAKRVRKFHAESRRKAEHRARVRAAERSRKAYNRAKEKAQKKAHAARKKAKEQAKKKAAKKAKEQAQKERRRLARARAARKKAKEQAKKKAAKRAAKRAKEHAQKKRRRHARARAARRKKAKEQAKKNAAKRAKEHAQKKRRRHARARAARKAAARARAKAHRRAKESAHKRAHHARKKAMEQSRKKAHRARMAKKKREAKVAPKWHQYCAVKTTMHRLKGKCRAYKRFCGLYRKFGMPAIARKHCRAMRKAHHTMVKKAMKPPKRSRWPKMNIPKNQSPGVAKRWGNIIDSAMKRLKWYHKRLAKRDKQLKMAKKAAKAEIEASQEDEKALSIEKKALRQEEARVEKYKKSARHYAHRARREKKAGRSKYLSEKEKLSAEANDLALAKRSARRARDGEDKERSKLKLLREELQEAKEEDAAYQANNAKLRSLEKALDTKPHGIFQQ